VFRVFKRLDYLVEISFSDGVYEIKVRLDQPTAARLVHEGGKGAAE